MHRKSRMHGKYRESRATSAHSAAPLRRLVLPLTLLVSSLGACASSPPRSVENAAESELALEREPFLPENVATAILLGSALLEAGDVRGALDYYEFAHRSLPEDLELGRRYIELALRTGRGSEALAALDRILVAHPEQRDLALQRVRVLSLLGENDLALRESAALVLEHPVDLEVLDLHADLLMGAREWAGALQVIDTMLGVRPDEAVLWSRKAVLLEALERPVEAEAAWRRTLELNPSDVTAIDRMTDLLRSSEREGELIELLESLRRRTDVDPLVQARLADLYLAKGDFARTVELLEPLADRGVLEPRARVILADLLANLDRREDAIEVLEELVASGTRAAPVLRMLGELQLDAGRLEEARANLRAAIDADPDDPASYVSLLVVLGQSDPGLLRGEGDDATRAELAALIDRAETLAEADDLRQNFLLGAVIRRTGDLERAKPLLRRARDLQPDNRQVLYDLAIVEEGTGDFEAAVQTLAKLLELDPDNAHLMNFYGYLLADQGWELDKAEVLIRAAVAEEPDNGAYVDSLGWVLYRKGDLDGALEQLIVAANLVGDDPVVLEHLGDCLRDLGQLEEALRTYRRALGAGGAAERLGARIEAVETEIRGGP